MNLKHTAFIETNGIVIQISSNSKEATNLVDKLLNLIVQAANIMESIRSKGKSNE